MPSSCLLQAHAQSLDLSFVVVWLNSSFIIFSSSPPSPPLFFHPLPFHFFFFPFFLAVSSSTFSSFFGRAFVFSDPQISEYRRNNPWLTTPVTSRNTEKSVCIFLLICCQGYLVLSINMNTEQLGQSGKYIEERN